MSDEQLRAEAHELGLECAEMITKAARKYGNYDWYYRNVALQAITNYYDAMFDAIKQKHGLPATQWEIL